MCSISVFSHTTFAMEFLKCYDNFCYFSCEDVQIPHLPLHSFLKKTWKKTLYQIAWFSTYQFDYKINSPHYFLKLIFSPFSASTIL